MSITVLILLFSQECHKSVSFFQECNTAFADGNVFGQQYLKILHFPVLSQCRQLSEMAVSSILSSLAPVPGTQVPFLSLLTKGNLWGRGDGLAGDAAPAQESVAQCGSCLQVWAWTAVEQWPQVTPTWRHLTDKKTTEQIAQIPSCPSKHVFIHVCVALPNTRQRRGTAPQNCNCSNKYGTCPKKIHIACLQSMAFHCSKRGAGWTERGYPAPSFSSGRKAHPKLLLLLSLCSCSSEHWQFQVCCPYLLQDLPAKRWHVFLWKIA